MITDQELKDLLAASPAERITEEYMKGRIANTDYTFLGTTTTICSIVLDNGFSVHGTSACVNKANFNKEIGKKIAHNNAFRQLWPLFGFLLAEKNLLTTKGVKL